MVKGAFAGAPLVLLILSLLTSAFAVQQTVALTTLFIRADGSGSRPYNPGSDFLDENYIGPRSPQRTPNPLQLAIPIKPSLLLSTNISRKN
jgi:hypothetical protein